MRPPSVPAKLSPLMFLRQLAYAALGVTCLSIALAQTAVLTDVAASSPDKAAIESMVAQGVMPARPDHTFAPDAAVTRGEFAQALSRLFDLPKNWARPITFSDMPPNNPLYGAVTSAAPFMSRQIFCPGCALRTDFMPEQPVSRLEATVDVVRVLQARRDLPVPTVQQGESIVESVPSAPGISERARAMVAFAVKTGVTPMQPDAVMAAHPPMSRAELAVLLDHVQTKFSIPKVSPP